MVSQKVPARAQRCRGALRVSASERDQLQRWARSATRPHRIVVRSRIVLLASNGLGVSAIARRLHVSRTTVRLWCGRFAEGGLRALESDAPGRGRPAGMARERVLAVLRAMRDVSVPARSTRRIAAGAGTSASSVWRVWKRHGLSGTSSAQEIESVLDQLISETPKQGR